MPKRLIKSFMPDHAVIRNHKHLRMFGTLLHEPNLWHLNRRSASGGFAVGLFLAFAPIPFQMLLAAATAIAIRVNLPLSVALVWLTNPITMPPIFYGAYRLGAWLIGTPIHHFQFELSLSWFTTEMSVIWQPLLLGSLLLGTLSAAVGFVAVRSLWRLRLVQHHQRRKQDRASREAAQQRS